MRATASLKYLKRLHNHMRAAVNRKEISGRELPDVGSIMPFPVEAIHTIAAVDFVLEKIKSYEQRPNIKGSDVGVVLRQNAACAGSYLIRTIEEAPVGQQLGHREWYVNFWPKQYFLGLKQKLLQNSGVQPQYA